jgi:Flp pilus assembly protein TadG
MVEFALASLAFMLIILGTIDFGRGIYTATTLRSSVREGVRIAKMSPTDTTSIKSAVTSHAPGLGLTSSSITVSCTGTCATGDSVTVAATMQFSPVAQSLLKVGSITLTSSAKGEIE